MNTFLLIVVVIIVIVLLIYFTSSKSDSPEKSAETSANNKQEHYQDLVDKDILFNTLIEDGYSRKNTNYSIKFFRDFEAVSGRAELEFSTLKKTKGNLDIDVSKAGFTIHLPENVSPAFFDHVVFQNYNKMLKETTNMELLPDVQGVGYYLRSSSKHPDWKLPSYSLVKPGIQARFDFFDDFPFILQEDYEQPFFQSLLKDGYDCHFAPNQMLLRFCKAIDQDHLSVYYVKALKMLFLASSKLTNAEIQEDFRDDQTKLHHFTKEEGSKLEEVEKNKDEELEQDDSNKEELSAVDFFPSFEEFKVVEAEFLLEEEEEEEYEYDEEE